MPRLYELTQHMLDIRDVLLNAADDDGEVQPEIAAMLATAEGDWRQKLEACARVVCDLEAEQSAYKDHGDRLMKRARAIGKNAERLKDYMKLEMEAAGEMNVACIPPVAIRRNPPSVVITDIDAVPHDYDKPPREREVSRSDIAEALKAGIDVPGAEMRQGTSIRIG